MGVDDSPDGRVRQRSLPPEPTSPRLAREFVRAACRDWSIDDETCEDAALVATELVSNVVDHARTSCVVRVSRTGTGCRIDVEDRYPAPLPGPRPIDLAASRGRGLQVVAGVATTWGVRDLPGGKAVWAVLDSG